MSYFSILYHKVQFTSKSICENCPSFLMHTFILNSKSSIQNMAITFVDKYGLFSEFKGLFNDIQIFHLNFVTITILFLTLQISCVGNIPLNGVAASLFGGINLEISSTLIYSISTMYPEGRDFILIFLWKNLIHSPKLLSKIYSNLISSIQMFYLCFWD